MKVPRAHLSVAKDGCTCARCERHRGQDKTDLRALIRLYEDRVKMLKMELAK